MPAGSPDALHPIAIGVDERDEGRDAVVLGTSLASATNAELLLAGVYPEPIFPVPEALSRRALRAETLASLGQVRDELAPGATVTAECDLSVAHGLARVVRRRRAGLLVLGSSPRAKTGRIAIGARTRQLLEHAGCPLAVAPRGIAKRGAPKLATIGLGYDGGPEASAALGFAVALAHAAHATLRVRAVVDARRWVGAAYAVSIDWKSLIEDERAGMLRRVDTALENVEGTVEREVVVGSAGSELSALSESVDLLVIGSRRWGAIARVVSGSTGEALLSGGASCPVVLVPRPKAR
jgi:nucleotide-binding universal stress UspA family protein